MNKTNQTELQVRYAVVQALNAVQNAIGAPLSRNAVQAIDNAIRAHVTDTILENADLQRSLYAPPRDDPPGEQLVDTTDVDEVASRASRSMDRAG